MDSSAVSTGAVSPVDLKTQWSPYMDNGGTTCAISGKDFAVIAADTRLSEGYRVHSRQKSKLIRLTSKAVLASAGMQAEIATLHKLLKIRVTVYTYQHRKVPSIVAISQMLSNVLYYKRFFPYYTFNVLAGIDDDGRGAVFSYDAVGSFQRDTYGCSGTGSALMFSILDHTLRPAHQQTVDPAREPTIEEALQLAKEALTAATERDIYTGDFAEIIIVDANGSRSAELTLKHD